MSILGWSDRSLEHSSKPVSGQAWPRQQYKKAQSPDPTVPPPPAAHSKPPACIDHYCPQANINL